MTDQATTEQIVTLRGIDPLLFRDGRPFSDEVGALAAQSLSLPLPGTVAGAIRTRLGTVAGWNWQDGTGAANALQVAVAGPILMRNEQPVFVAPADAVIHKNNEKLQVMTLRPYASGTLPQGAGCDIGDALLPMEITDDCKPERGYDYWSMVAMEQWLLDRTGKEFAIPESVGQPLRDERVHVAINRESGISEEGKLFLTQSLCFEDYARWDETKPNRPTAIRWQILARVGHSQAGLFGPVPFGGERRLAVIEHASAETWPACPSPLLDAISGTSGKVQLRLVLATPALFANGWRPRWIGQNMQGNLHGVALTLMGAAIKRREPVSGWDYATRGAKPVRWMVPAGSVYFFLAEGNVEGMVQKLWLQSVADGAQEQRDGYGLALWGLW
jgi:CRISPR-associated protein Cmr3